MLDPIAISPTALTAKVVLVIEEERTTCELMVSVLQRNGYEVLTASDGADALALVARFCPDLIISDITIANRSESELLKKLRADPRTSALPVIFLTPFEGVDDTVTASRSGVDGYIMKPVRPPELVARVRATLTRTPVPVDQLHDRRSVERTWLVNEHAAAGIHKRYLKRAILSENAFDVECKFELERGQRERLPFSMAYIKLFELAGIRESFGQRGQATIAHELALLTERFPNVARLGIDGNGHFMLLIRATGVAARILLNNVSRSIVAHRFHLGIEPIRLTPIVGFAGRSGTSTIQEMRSRASSALTAAESQLDLEAVSYSSRLERTVAARRALPLFTKARALLAPLSLPLQIMATLVGCLVVPFGAYWFFGAHGADISNVVYVTCVVMLCLTALGIMWETLLALRDDDPPSADVYPLASAIIAAYLPNEAATVIETIEAFLRVNYAADLQIILAYNTPRSLPMEEELQAIARRDPRFVPLRVHGSTSKAQNVNAALRIVRGAFVGVFDADHKPDPDSFTRAWNWLAHGYDVVQGHCLIRNGDESLIAKLVAVEFESIYAVSHPGRARLHGFGLFGGSNGYWKTDLLRQTRMHRFMLTEDIDSSLRVIEAGYRIASDRKLISRELAPITLHALWHQRLRWAQGWFQVSLKHLIPALRSPQLSLRQKFGMLHLLLWRECYVWVSVQILPILAYWLFVRHERLSWSIPIFLVTTLLTALTGPLQLLFTYKLAHPEIRKRRSWFFTNVIASFLFFTELKNIIARLAHLKEAMRERTWKVTPRSSSLPHA